jgi:hypothetical protein
MLYLFSEVNLLIEVISVGPCIQIWFHAFCDNNCINPTSMLNDLSSRAIYVDKFTKLAVQFLQLLRYGPCMHISFHAFLL